MFTRIFTKIASLILQIVVVVAGVLVFAYFDPFGLLTPKKQTLKDTPITVVSIKEIGQLVTAEYYGEVLSSLQDTLIAEVQITDTQLIDDVGRLNGDYIQALQRFHAGKDTIRARLLRRKKDLVESFYSANASLINNPFYQEMVELVLAKEQNKFDSEGELLRDLWKKDVVNFTTPPYQNRYVLDSKALVKHRKDELEDLKQTRSFKKRQIVVIGRGWVKAGIDFGRFTDRNFKYDKASKTIYLFGVKPVILDYDINPWFIPEKRVRGFEIIAATNRANDPADLLKVKEHCLNKLRMQAETNGILAQAKINAEESLKSFFSLLIDDPIEKVSILETSLADFYEEMPKEGLLSAARLPRLDSILLGIEKIDRDSALLFASALQKRYFYTGQDTFPITRFSSLAYAAAEDELITRDEWTLLQDAMHRKKLSRVDSVWFFPGNKQYDVLSGKARSDALKKRSYSWWDSVLVRENYQYFDSVRNVNLRAYLYNNMATRRDSSIAGSLVVLRKYVKTIDTPDAQVNCTDNIEGCLNLLTKH